MPNTIPILARRVSAQDLNSIKEDTRRAVVREDFQTFTKSCLGRVQVLSKVTSPSCLVAFAQTQQFFRQFSGRRKQFENARGFNLAFDKNGVDLSHFEMRACLPRMSRTRTRGKPNHLQGDRRNAHDETQSEFSCVLHLVIDYEDCVV